MTWNLLLNFFALCFSQKKALQAWKAPKPEPERATPTQKRPTEGRDAREVARKLLKSGAITAIPKIQKRPEQAGFKRPQGLQRKLSAADRTVSSYQPFQASHADEVPGPPTESSEKPRVKVCVDFFCLVQPKTYIDFQFLLHILFVFINFYFYFRTFMIAL